MLDVENLEEIQKIILEKKVVIDCGEEFFKGIYVKKFYLDTKKFTTYDAYRNDSVYDCQQDVSRLASSEGDIRERVRSYFSKYASKENVMSSKKLSEITKDSSFVCIKKEKAPNSMNVHITRGTFGEVMIDHSGAHYILLGNKVSKKSVESGDLPDNIFLADQEKQCADYLIKCLKEIFKNIYGMPDVSDIDSIPSTKELSEAWVKFIDSKMLWYINTIICIFGWCIMYRRNIDGSIAYIRPVRTTQKGFSDYDNKEGYKKLDLHLKEYFKNKEE